MTAYVSWEKRGDPLNLIAASFYHVVLTSDGTPGVKWIELLEERGVCVGGYAKKVLLSPEFMPTTGVTYGVAILAQPHGSSWMDEIKKYAKRRGFLSPHPELACLICDLFMTDNMFRLWMSYIVTMHEPILVDGEPQSLIISHKDGRFFFNAYEDLPGMRYPKEGGFLYLESG